MEDSEMRGFLSLLAQLLLWHRENRWLRLHLPHLARLGRAI